MLTVTNQTTPDNPTLSGAKFRMGHKATVVGVLGARAPEVHSRGTHFYNKDRWTARGFVAEMCKWAKENPQCIPTPGVIGAWVRAANNAPIPKREIVIANTPDTLQLRTAMALMGGAYHEAFHTHFSCLRQLKEAEMIAMVIPRWAKVPDWSKFHNLLQTWNNVIEDIRIERRGREDFPGCEVKLHDLQDLILSMEQDPKFVGGRAHEGTPLPHGALSLIMCTFRDIGLGYNTPTQKAALEAYRAEDERAVEFVIGRGKGNPGPLTALLKESIAMPRTDDIGCVRVAMDVIGILFDNSSAEDPANDPNNQQHQPGQAQKPQCPKCGAPGSKLVIRPKSNGNGGKVQGIGILTCSVCGHQEEAPLQPPKPGKGQKTDPKDQPKFEGFDPPEKPEKGADKGDKDKDAKAEKGDKDEGTDPSKGKGSKDNKDKAAGSGGGEGDPDEDGEDPADTEGEGSDEGEADTDSGKGDPTESGEGAGEEGEGPGAKAKGKPSDDDGTEGEGAEGEGGDSEGEGTEGDPSGDMDSHGYREPDEEGRDEGFNQGGNKANTDADVKDQAAAGGGHTYEEPQILGNDWSNLTDAALQDANKPVKALDNNSALEGAVAADEAKALKTEGGVKSGETRWQPFDPAQDEVIFVQPSARGKDADMALAEQLYASIRTEASFLRSRFRQIIRAMEMTSTVHGMPKGRRLSSRFLVDSKVTLMSNMMPRRAYKQTDEQIDTSLAAAVVLDQSLSMKGLLRDATRIMCAITEPLDALGCPVQVSGFRDGRYYSGDADGIRGGTYHRTESITHDVFKGFNEPLRAVRWRFANTRATGGTPMADGVQFGLQGLSKRTEGHRILFIVTDGQPNGGHMPIIRRQVRLAKEAGIHVIGVGIGYGASYVQNVFPDSVWTPQVADMPAALIAKLNQIIDKTGSKRGAKFAG